MKRIVWSLFFLPLITFAQIRNGYIRYDSTHFSGAIDANNITLISTIAGLRSLSNPSTTATYQITDAGKEGLFRYDASDVISADNTGTIILNGTKRYKRIINGSVYASWFDVKGDSTTDNYAALTAATNYCTLNKISKLVLPQGAIGIATTWDIGAAITGNSSVSFTIEGQGLQVYPPSPSGGGTSILWLGASGAGTKVVNLKAGAFRYMKFKGWGITVPYNDAAEVGFNCENSQFSTFEFEDWSVGDNSASPTIGFKLNVNGAGNAEFNTFYRCRFSGTLNAFYNDAPQALSTKFFSCSGLVQESGTVLNFVASSGFTATGCDFSGPNAALFKIYQASTAYTKGLYVRSGTNLYRVATAGTTGASSAPSGAGTAISDGSVSWDYVRASTGTTLLSIGGTQLDPMVFVGGRSELIARIVEFKTGSVNLHVDINGLTCTMPAHVSTAIPDAIVFQGTAQGRVNIDGAVFYSGAYGGETPGPIMQAWPINLGTSESAQITMRGTTFAQVLPTVSSTASNNLRTVNATSQSNMNKVEAINCIHWINTGHAPKSFLLNKVYLDNTQTGSKMFRMENLLLQSKFTESTGSSVTANSPWVHTGTASFLTATNLVDGTRGVISSYGKSVSLDVNSGVYQDITALDITQANVTLAHYKALVSLNINAIYRASLVNSATGAVYDSITLYPDNVTPSTYRYKKHEIDLYAQTPVSQTGSLRLKIENISSVAALTLNIYWQHLFVSYDAKFAPTTSSTVSKTQVWDDIPKNLKVLNRLQVPMKSNTYGSATSIENEGDLYVSLEDSTLNISDGNKWQSFPRQDRGTAAPTTGTWPLGFIRWNSNPTGTTIGWYCSVAGTPGTWPAINTFASTDTLSVVEVDNKTNRLNAFIQPRSIGTLITRDIVDANTALTVNENSGTGNILDLLYGNVRKSYFDKDGNIVVANASVSHNIGVFGSTSNGIIFANGGSPTTHVYMKGLVSGTEKMRLNPNADSWINGGSLGIGNASPAASSILDLTSTTKGFLPPRVTATQQAAISSPATGLMVYNTDTLAYFSYNGSAWAKIGGATGTSTTDASLLTSGTLPAARLPLLAGFAPGAGTILTSDSYIQGLQKNAGNIAANILAIGGKVDTSYGYITSASLITSGLLHISPVTGVVSNHGLTFTQTLANQSPYTLLGRGSGTGVPSFLSSIDSNWIPTLHSKGYYDALYTPLAATALKEDVANKSTATALGTSNTLYPTQNAVKVYADTKQTAVALTTTGTSGAATFNSGTGALNIPNYAGGGPATGWIVPTGLVTGGVTDNRTAIQNAADAVHTAGGGVVYVPFGDFAVSQHVKVYDNTTIMGAGIGLTIFRPTGSTFVDSADATYGCIFITQGRSNVTFTGFTITGNTHQMAAGGIHINSKRPSGTTSNAENNILIDHIEIKDFYGKGIWFGSYATGETHYTAGITIQNCFFKRLYNPAKPFELIDQEFGEDNRYDAIYGLGGARKVTIVNNYIDSCSGDAVHGKGWAYTVPSGLYAHPDWMDIIISNNHVTNTWMGFEFEGFLSGSKSIVTNNTIKFLHRPNGAAYAFSMGGIGLKVTNNYVEQVEQSGFEIGGTGITMSGNTIKITVAKTGTPASVITGYNNSSNIRSFGIFAASASKFSNNLLTYDPVYTNGTVAATQMWGISLAGWQGSEPAYDDSTSDVTEISANTFIGITQRFVQASNQITNNVYIKNNVVRSRFVKQDQSMIVMWGHYWEITGNTFDFTGATTTGIGAMVTVSGSQSDSTKSPIYRNTIIGNSWSIGTNAKYTSFANIYTLTTGLTYVVDEVPRMTTAQRTSLTGSEGMTVFQTDGTAGKYLYTSGAWAIQTGSGGGSTVKTYFSEDYVGGTQGLNLVLTQSGTSATAGSAIFPTVTGATGMLQMNTGTTTTGRGHIGTFLGSVDLSTFGVGTYTFETNYFRIVNKSTGTETFRLYIGFGDVNSAPDQTNGVYFTTKTTSDTLFMVTANGGTRTETGTDVLVTDNLKITSLKIVVDVAAQTAKFYYNNTLKGTLTTNIPQTQMGIGYGIFKSAGTTARRIDVDNIILTN